MSVLDDALAGHGRYSRAPTEDEIDRFITPAIDRLFRKHPCLRDGGKLREDDLVGEIINQMVVWMAETPGWELIP